MDKARLLELESILKKRTWYEETLLIAEYHEIAQSIYGAPNPADGNKGGWSMNDTAKAIGISLSSVLVNLRLAKCCGADPTIAAHKSRALAIEDMYLKFSWAGNDKLVRRV
jgi:hypothetical protein